MFPVSFVDVGFEVVFCSEKIETVCDHNLHCVTEKSFVGVILFSLR